MYYPLQLLPWLLIFILFFRFRQQVISLSRLVFLVPVLSPWWPCFTKIIITEFETKQLQFNIIRHFKSLHNFLFLICYTISFISSLSKWSFDTHLHVHPVTGRSEWWSNHSNKCETWPPWRQDWHQENQSWKGRKSPTCRKSLTNFIT
jgi:hypothetical protein